MEILLAVVAVAWTVSGFLLFSHPEGVREFVRKTFPPVRMKALAPAPAAFGLLLVIGAFVSDEFFWIPLLLGLLGLAKGAYFYSATPEKLKQMLDQWVLGPEEKTLKKYGIAVFATGLVLLAIVA